MPGLGENYQEALNSMGLHGQNAAIGIHKVFFTGTTGLIGTHYGVAGVSATRVSTGLYTFRHPSTVHVDILTQIEAPTGCAYNVNVVRDTKNSQSGIFQVQIMGNATSIGTGVPSGMIPYAPQSGTALKLMFFVSPVTPF